MPSEAQIKFRETAHPPGKLTDVSIKVRGENTEKVSSHLVRALLQSNPRLTERSILFPTLGVAALKATILRGQDAIEFFDQLEKLFAVVFDGYERTEFVNACAFVLVHGTGAVLQHSL